MKKRILALMLALACMLCAAALAEKEEYAITLAEGGMLHGMLAAKGGEEAPVNLLAGERAVLRVRAEDGAYLMDGEERIELDALEADTQGYLYAVEKRENGEGERRVALYAQDESEPRAAYAFFESEEALNAAGTWRCDGQEGKYAVTVLDADGQPIPGAMMQVCDDKTCMVLTTDENGVVEHAGAPYAYEIHVLKAPKGFAKCADTFVMPEAGGEMTIVLAAAE